MHTQSPGLSCIKMPYTLRFTSQHWNQRYAALKLSSFSQLHVFPARVLETWTWDPSTLSLHSTAELRCPESHTGQLEMSRCLISLALCWLGQLWICHHCDELSVLAIPLSQSRHSPARDFLWGSSLSSELFLSHSSPPWSYTWEWGPSPHLLEGRISA